MLLHLHEATEIASHLKPSWKAFRASIISVPPAQHHWGSRSPKKPLIPLLWVYTKTTSADIPVSSFSSCCDYRCLQTASHITLSCHFTPFWWHQITKIKMIWKMNSWIFSRGSWLNFIIFSYSHLKSKRILDVFQCHYIHFLYYFLWLLFIHDCFLHYSYLHKCNFFKLYYVTYLSNPASQNPISAASHCNVCFRTYFKVAFSWKKYIISSAVQRIC